MVPISPHHHRSPPQKKNLETPSSQCWTIIKVPLVTLTIPEGFLFPLIARLLPLSHGALPAAACCEGVRNPESGFGLCSKHSTADMISPSKKPCIKIWELSWELILVVIDYTKGVDLVSRDELFRSSSIAALLSRALWKMTEAILRVQSLPPWGMLW